MDNLAKLDKWNAVKKSIDTQNFKKQVEIQSIYWISIGQNVGSEVFGKSGIFTRPVLVVNVFFNGTFLGVPLSSKAQNKKGKFYHKFIDSKGKMQVALLGQVRIFDSKRKTTNKHISKVNDKDFLQIKDKLKSVVIVSPLKDGATCSCEQAKSLIAERKRANCSTK